MRPMKWRVKFMRRGWEPPYPFGKSVEIVEADSRLQAIDLVRRSGEASPRYPISASKVREEATGGSESD